jgi:thiol-disulfide isomerase/thioredoxin
MYMFEKIIIYDYTHHIVMKYFAILIAIGLLLPGVIAQDAEIKKMSKIDTSKGIVILEFMSTTCPACQKQIDELKKVYEQYSDKVRILSVDVAREPEELLANYKKEVGAEWEFAIDDNGAYFTYARTMFIPAIVILKDGEIVYRHVGVTSGSDLIREIEKVL